MREKHSNSFFDRIQGTLQQKLEFLFQAALLAFSLNPDLNKYISSFILFFLVYSNH